jgi:hypothetical protein
MRARQAVRLERFEANLDAAVERLNEARERARFRRELDASDMPDAIKTVLGALVDPAGFVLDHVIRAEREAPR